MAHEGPEIYHEHNKTWLWFRTLGYIKPGSHSEFWMDPQGLAITLLGHCRHVVTRAQPSLT